MNRAAVFSPRLLGAWAIAAAVAVGGLLYFLIGGVATDDVGPNTASRSAIGYAGLADLLEKLGIRVIRRPPGSTEKLPSGSVLVIAEPRALPQWRAAPEGASILLVLPKWRGEPSKRRPGWLAKAALQSPLEAQRALALILEKAEVVHTPSAVDFAHNALGGHPSPAAPVQLIRSERLKPIVGGGEGMLVAEFADPLRRFWILSDPDVLANHRLDEDGNAEFAVALINALRRGECSVAFEETVRGRAAVARPASPLMLLLQFPFVLATVQGAIAIALLLWATLGRFGAPEPAPPALRAGRQGLIENAAKLLEFAGHQQIIVQRYVHATIGDVARQLRAPQSGPEGTPVEWLRRVGRARGASIDCGAVLRRADELVQQRRGDPAQLASAARDIYRWKREIIDGTGRHPRDR